MCHFASLSLFILLSICFNSQAQITHPDEVKALESVKLSLNDPMKNLNNWNNRDPCTAKWIGVFCYDQPLDDGYLHLWKLQLMNLNLFGTLSPKLGNFSHLEILNFMWNDIGGSIPEAIGNLKNLQLLLLNGNKLTGSLPNELGYLPNLRMMQIEENKISGPLPKSFANLNKLQHFHMNNNSIAGEIPRELSSLQSLLHFMLDNNNLSGSLPAEFSEMPNLLILQLDNNNFNGSEIPTAYANMAGLVKLSLRNCSLQGSIPNLSRMPNLSYIDLSLNQLNGPIPSDKLADNMTTIILSHNNLSGTIPTNFSRLPLLQKLSLDDNLLSGSVSFALWQTRRLTDLEKLTLDFHNNNLTEITGSSSLAANVTLLLRGNPLCTNESIAELYCGSPAPVDNTQDTRVTNDTFTCHSPGCPSPNEYAPSALLTSCYCAAPLIIHYRLESPGFTDFRPYQIGFEKFLTAGLSLSVDQLNISFIEWQEGPRLFMILKLFPVYEKATNNYIFNTSDVQRIWRMLSGWEIPSNYTFGPYELLDFILLDPYKEELYGAPSSSDSNNGTLIGIIVGTIVVALAGISAIVSFLIIKKNLRKYIVVSKRHKSSRIPIDVQGVRGFTYKEMAHATSNFCNSNEVGQGGYGKVYKGVLADGALVAIKRAQEGSLQGIKEFCTEIKLLSRLHHKHLVSLVGYCYDKGEQMLVYEFMPNGTLKNHLSAWSKEPLRFATRMRLALESTRGLLYLHTEADPPIFHRDVKATNILLDSKFTAKVADFGLSRLAPEHDVDGILPTHVSTVVKGTPGYLDPEYFRTRKLTDKTDVYGLGVVFLELLTGMQPISNGKHIVREVNSMYLSGNVSSLVEKRMGSYPPECAERFASLALRCCEEETAARPMMAEIVRELEAIIQMIPEYSDTGSTTESSYNNPTNRDSTTSSSSRMKTPSVYVPLYNGDLVSEVFPRIDPR